MSADDRAVALTADEADDAPLPRGVSHLLVADDALIPGRWGVHITLCGAEMRHPGANAAEDDYPPDLRYCPACMAQAARCSAEQAGDRQGSLLDQNASGPDDGSEPRSYYVGGCGHRRPIQPDGHVVPCPCDSGATACVLSVLRRAGEAVPPGRRVSGRRP